jgi:ATP synthase F1 gamma subunit
MAGGQERVLRRRIRSVQSTRKITKAMELIAASRIVRAQARIAANRPYRVGMEKDPAPGDGSEDPTAAKKLLGTPESPRVGVLAIVGDRGLAGSYNSGVLRATERLVAEHVRNGADVTLWTVGKKAPGYFRYRGIEVARSFAGMADRPEFADARAVAAAVTAPFVAGEMDLVQMVSTRFISAGTQRVETCRCCPSRCPTLPEPEEAGASPAPARGRVHRVRARRGDTVGQVGAPGGRSGDLRRPARGVGVVLHRPAAGHGGGDRERRRARPHPDPRHEPRPSGLHHHRDHGNRWRRRGAPPIEGSLTTMTTTANQDTVPAGTLEDGRVVSIAGPVIDVEFPPHALPEINHAVEFTIELDGTTSQVTAEVAQQIGDGRVRCICMQQTDGLVRGAPVRNLGRGITVPVGNAVLGSRLQRAGPAARHRLGRGRRRLLGDPPQRAGLRPAGAEVGPRCSRPGSRWSTCSSPTCRVGRSASSVGPAWARPSSSKR